MLVLDTSIHVFRRVNVDGRVKPGQDAGELNDPAESTRQADWRLLVGATGSRITGMIRIGMLTPSSNTVLEPVTAQLVAGVHDISVHVSRFAVTQIGLDTAALQQFDDAPILRAAELLAHAKVDVIAWNGTSASWLGLDRDRELVARIEAATGIKAATCMLGYFDLFRSMGVTRLGLVTPYTDDVQAKIVANYASEGVEVVCERHLGIRDNFRFGMVPEADIAAMIMAVAKARPDAITIVCTNMKAARVASDIERDTGIPVLDSVAVTLWACLVRAGVDPGMIKGWGGLFAMSSVSIRRQ
jgi:maleate isomerase